MVGRRACRVPPTHLPHPHMHHTYKHPSILPVFIATHKLIHSSSSCIWLVGRNVGTADGPFFELQCSGEWAYAIESCKDSPLWNFQDEEMVRRNCRFAGAFACACARARACVCVCVVTHQCHSFIRSCVRSFVPSFLPSFLPSFRRCMQ